MLLLTTAAHPTIEAWRTRGEASAHLGRLVTPGNFSRASDTAGAGIPWAADNDGFRGVDFEAFERMVVGLAHLPGCLFVTVPDVLADAGQTLLLWDEWAPVVMRYGLPAALVLQDGMTPADVPWRAVDALFIGGTDAYKLGSEVRAIVKRAREQRRRLHVHMGRVNTYKRIRYAAEIGCDSFDGSKYSRWRDTHLPNGLAAAMAVAGATPLALDV